LPTTLKILAQILQLRLTPYTEEIIGDRQCEFQCTRSTTDHTFCIHEILEKKWGYNVAVHQLFIDFQESL
jgi:hypothetical protein